MHLQIPKTTQLFWHKKNCFQSCTTNILKTFKFIFPSALKKTPLYFKLFNLDYLIDVEGDLLLQQNCFSGSLPWCHPLPGAIWNQVLISDPTSFDLSFRFFTPCLIPYLVSPSCQHMYIFKIPGSISFVKLLLSCHCSFHSLNFYSIYTPYPQIWYTIWYNSPLFMCLTES